MNKNSDQPSDLLIKRHSVRLRVAVIFNSIQRNSYKVKTISRYHESSFPGTSKIIIIILEMKKKRNSIKIYQNLKVLSRVIPIN